jgi:hypothetical protein
MLKIEVNPWRLSVFVARKGRKIAAKLILKIIKIFNHLETFLVSPALCTGL